MKSWAPRLLLSAFALLFSLLFTFLLLEVWLLFHQDYDVEMWRYAKELKLEVPDARGYVHKPNKTVEKLMGVPVRINSAGFRGPEFIQPKPSGVFRILAVGDSFTLGWGVKEEETFAHLLGHSLAPPVPGKKVEVLNLGHGNYNTAQEAELLRRVGPSLQPDMVLLFFYLNDAEPMQISSRGFWNLSASTVLVRQRIGRMKSMIDPNLNYESFYRGLYQGESGKDFRRHLIGLVESQKALNTPLAVVLLPDLRKGGEYLFRKEHQVVKSILEEQQVKYVDLADEFTTDDPASLWAAPDDPHPNGQAHARIAKRVKEFLIGEKLL